jgi:hypothetical protein
MRNDWEEKMFEIKRMDLDWNGEILERIAAARIGACCSSVLSTE